MQKTTVTAVADYYFPVFLKLKQSEAYWTKLQPIEAFFVLDCILHCIESGRCLSTNQQALISIAQKLANSLIKTDSRLRPLLEARLKNINENH